MLQFTKELLKNQKDEITSFHIYKAIATKQKDPANAKLLSEIAADEKGHYALLKRHTKTEVRPSWIKIIWYLIIAKILGITFSLKLLEKGEETATKSYNALIAQFP